MKTFTDIVPGFDLQCRAARLQKRFCRTPLDGCFLLFHDFLEFTSIFDAFLPCKIIFYISTRSHRKLQNIIQAYVDNIQLSKKNFLKVGLLASKKDCVILLIESPLKMTKNAFISSEKLFSFSRYLSFCHDFLVM